MRRYMIYRPRDGKLGNLLYKTKKEATDRGLKRDTEWVVVEVRTAVTDDVAQPDQVEIVGLERNTREALRT